MRHGYSIQSQKPLVFCSPKSISRATGLNLQTVRLILTQALIKNADFMKTANPENSLIKELEKEFSQFKSDSKCLDYACTDQNLRQMAHMTLRE